MALRTLSLRHRARHFRWPAHGIALAGVLLALFGASTAGVCAGEKSGKESDLGQLGLEDLMQLEVTTASKRPQKMLDIAAAAYVITAEDIRRSGATCIPELLRTVPGLQVSRIDNTMWAISARGFNQRFANKLLVMIDGRIIYTPLFSGTFWEQHPVPLPDIERIEVIRGPDATLWGANAVNGVINIITKKAEDTQGLLLSGGGFGQQRGMGLARYGGRLGERGAFRLSGEFTDRPSGLDALGGDARDPWHEAHGGFRWDQSLSDRDALTLTAGAHDGRKNAVISSPLVSDMPVPYDETGQYVVGRWERGAGTDSTLELRVSYNHLEKMDATTDPVLQMIPLSVRFTDEDTFAADFQHSLKPARRHQVVWGLGTRHYRSNRGVSNLTPLDTWGPKGGSMYLYSGFAQDEIALADGKWRFTLGTKLEQGSFSGFEVQPNARLLFAPDDRQSVWASVSRAIRAPNMAEHALAAAAGPSQIVPASALPVGAPPPVDALVGGALSGGDPVSEEMISYEVGYRARASDRLHVDVAAFFNTYDKLRTFEAKPHLMFPATVAGQPVTIIPIGFGNNLYGDTWGTELAADYRMAHSWRLHAAYTYLNTNLAFRPGSMDPLTPVELDANPAHQFLLRSSHDVSRSVDLDVWLRAVDELPSLSVPGYVDLDVNLNWRPRPNLELSLIGRSLLRDHHYEYGTDYFRTRPSQLERSVMAKASVEF